MFEGDSGISTNLTWDTQTSGNCEYSDPLGNILTSFFTNGSVNITNVYPTYYELDTATICEGETFVFGTQNLTTAGDYTELFQSQYGCDSTVTLTLFVNLLPTVNCPADTSVCLNSVPIILSSASPIGGIYSGTGVSSDIFDPVLSGTGVHDVAYTYIDTNSCENSCLFHINVFPTYEFITDTEICNGDTINWQGNDYFIAGTYHDSLMTSVGCDSIYILNLIVNPSYEFITDTEICNGDTVNWRGNDYFIAGTYYDSLMTSVGCDSIYILNLIVNPSYEFITDTEICNGDTINWRGNDYFIAGTYYDSLMTSVGCDSIYILNLTINNLPLVSISGLDNFYCEYANPVSMIGTPTGGTFNGQGVSGDVFDPAAAGLGVWPITYLYTDQYTCTGSDTIYVEIDECVGIKEHCNDNITIYPNPTTGIFNIVFSKKGKFIIEIYNITGQLIYQQSFLNINVTQIDLSNSPPGVYSIKILNKEYTISKKIILSK